MNNEPVAWIDPKELDMDVSTSVTKHKQFDTDIPLYTHPAKTLTDDEDTQCKYCKQGCIRCDARKTLTDEEIISEWIGNDRNYYNFARAILRKANEK